jgi:hypothetical protein
VALAGAVRRSRVDGLLHDKTRPPGRKPLSEATVRQVVTKTTTEQPADATHWSARAMAKAVGSRSAACRRSGGLTG